MRICAESPCALQFSQTWVQRQAIRLAKTQTCTDSDSDSGSGSNPSVYTTGHFNRDVGFADLKYLEINPHSVPQYLWPRSQCQAWLIRFVRILGIRRAQLAWK